MSIIRSGKSPELFSVCESENPCVIWTWAFFTAARSAVLSIVSAAIDIALVSERPLSSRVASVWENRAYSDREISRPTRGHEIFLRSQRRRLSDFFSHVRRDIQDASAPSGTVHPQWIVQLLSQMRSCVASGRDWPSSLNMPASFGSMTTMKKATMPMPAARMKHG